MGVDVLDLWKSQMQSSIPLSIYITITYDADAATQGQNLSTLLKQVQKDSETSTLRLTAHNHQTSLKWNIPLSIYITITYDAD